MSSTAANRKAFIDSSLDVIIRFGYSGLDMDWAPPGVWGPSETST